MYSKLKDRLQKGEVIILDGGMGSELERRGVPMGMAAWSAAALKTHPDVVRLTHQDYIRAGADIIITNTFSSIRHSLMHDGMGELVRELNVRAVKLAQEARESTAVNRDVFIAGSISTYSPYRDPTLNLTPQQARADYAEQAGILAEAGVDLIMMEMMKDLEQSALAIEAALSTGLPTWVGFSCQLEKDSSEVSLLRQPDIPLAQALDLLMSQKELEGTVVSVMHTNVDDTALALDVLRQKWNGPIGAYPNSGWFQRPHWQFQNVISPQDLASEAKKWVQTGVQVIGGCCGLEPDHIRSLKQELPHHIPAS